MKLSNNAVKRLLFISCLAFLSSGCTPPKKMSIHHIANDGTNDVLVLKHHPSGNSYKLLESPNPIEKYSLTSDSEYLMYISRESDRPELFIQQLETGMRVKAGPIEDNSGEFISGDSSLGYISSKERIDLKYSVVEASMDEAEIRCKKSRQMKRPCTIESILK